MSSDDAVRVEPLDAGDDDAVEACAALLVDGFRQHWPQAWPTLDDARREMREALAGGRIALAARGGDGRVLGWIGAISTYDGNVWELHPMVVDGARRRRGIGRALVEALEAEVRARGGGTLYLGTDDEDEMTSVGGVDLYPDVLGRLREIRDVRGHPFGFYRRLGFEVVGILPDANGPGKPDIFMAKRISPEK
jgi:aminoglycoside 6'-N-acetyltransferase I